MNETPRTPAPTPARPEWIIRDHLAGRELGRVRAVSQRGALSAATRQGMWSQFRSATLATPAPEATPEATPEAALERVNTHALATGDIVHHYGMRVRLGERGERLDRGTGRTVVWFAGRVLNPAEVDPRLVPVSLRTTDRHPGYAPGEFWQIQGNELATWTREVRPATTPEPCYICGHGPHAPTDLHAYWSESDAAAEFTAADTHAPAYDASAAYVAQHRPY